jgi:hypothetical protein
MLKKVSDKNRYWLSLFGIILCFLVLNLDLISMSCLFKWDAWYLFWPQFKALSSSVQDFRLPLWDPRPNCGFPFHADPQTGSFYPVGLLVAYLFGASYKVFQYFWLAHWLAGGVGFWFFARRLKLSPGGTFVSAILFTFSGFFVSESQHYVCIVTVCYVPWILLLLEKGYDERISDALLAGVLFGFAGLGGHPGMTIYSALMIGVWCFVRFRRVRRVLGMLALFFLVATIVASPAYVSFLVEGIGYTDRIGFLPIKEALGVNRFPVLGLISLVAPGFTTAYPALIQSTGDQIAMLDGYFGIFGLLSLTVVAFTSELRKTWRLVLLFMLFVFLFSLGSLGGVGILTYYIFPPLRFVRHPSMVRIFWMLGGALLAGAVFDTLIGSSTRSIDRLVSKARLALLVIIAVALATLGCALMASQYTAYDFSFEFRHLSSWRLLRNSPAVALRYVAPSLVLALLYLLAFSQKTAFGLKKQIQLLLVVLVILDCAAHLFTNKPATCWNGKARHVSDQIQHMAVISATKEPTLSGRRVISTSIFNFWAFDNRPYVRAYIAPTSKSYDFLVGGTWPPYQTTKFLRVVAQGPRFWLTREVLYAPSRDLATLKRLRDTGLSQAVPVFVHERLHGVKEQTTTWNKAGDYGKVDVLQYRFTSVRLAVEAPESCWLFATERYAPGWRAYVDGRETKVYKANFCFRAISIPRGNHIVRFQYKPIVYRPLLWISWTLALIVIAYQTVSGLISLFRRRKVERGGRSK